MAKSLYKLSRELVGHSGDVRALAVASDGSIVSASRDKSAIFWKFQDGNFVGNVVMRGHSNFVSSVCIINPTQKHPKGLIITGSNDNHIFIYNPGEEQPVHKIKAHENTVCCLRTSSLDPTAFVSSSWDFSAKMWSLDDLEKPQMTYLGHSAAVWCVSDLANGSVVTGSADKLVIVYLRDGKVLHKLEGHTDCVRDIAVINENEFLTCANDAVIKHWTAVTGDCLGNFYGHTNYIYSLSAFPGGSLVASSGEDRTVRVWCNGEVDQTITLPTQTVWSVKLLPNGDIVCGASDGLVRIFTAHPERYADSEIIQRFEESVVNTELKAKQELGDIKMSDLPDASVLQQPGKKDGETKLVKEDGSVKAYSWSQKDLKWNLIGDVMGANSNNSSNMHNGIEYDYVFSVDIQDGVPPLKLPYNKGQDPWYAAQKFIDDNQLSQMFLEQVANFIIKNSTPAPVVNSAPQFYDPFTGGNRYIPAAPAQSPAQPTPTPPTVKPATPFKSTYMPMTNYLRLEQASLNAIHDKLKEFNSKQQAGVQSLPEGKIESVVKLATNQNQESVQAGSISLLSSLLSWPDPVVFPVLDIARLAVLQKNVNDQFCTEDLLHLVKRHLKTDAVVSNQMLTFRLLANMFCHEKGEKLGLQHRTDMLKAILDLPSLGNKNNQVAVSTYILNLVVAVNKTNDSAGKTQVLGVICNLLSLFKETEAVFRALVALGTLLTGSSSSERAEFVKVVGQSENALNVLQQASESLDLSVQNKLACVSKEIISLIA
ncbi:phospholipase A-2-activating protein isoform X4 [Nasonia vitripennis]|uniref:Phospholipase A-2-activating protein n=1 Tax=Nasonia vitripennis TaxID=7425 RepID=A0A7M7G7F3_NASVI|nr:phospholipase A-2-activating protein isoform X4 [Nasonia vitripennis]